MNSLTYFIYGMSVMFYFMMAWMFWRKGNDMLSRMIMCLMIIIGLQCVKDIALANYLACDEEYEWYLTNAFDMMIIPFYSFVLMELVKPGWFGWMKALMLEVPFLLLPVFFVLTRSLVWFYALTAWGAVYGCITFVLMFFLIARYHRQLKERFSYQDNINLNWLRAILNSFFLILLVWTVSCLMTDVDFDNIYMLCSLGIWMFICYFVYRHESVIDELSDADVVLMEEDSEEASGLTATVKRLFEDEKIYLNPKLKLSDVARAAGTNRTYLSRFFNQENGQTFYDFVNNYRIRFAEQLLVSSDVNLAEVAERSGFNSLSTFRRVFIACHGCSPIEYRNNKV